MDFGFGLAFGEKEVEGKPVVEALQNMLSVVGDTMKDFEPLLV